MILVFEQSFIILGPSLAMESQYKIDLQENQSGSF